MAQWHGERERQRCWRPLFSCYRKLLVMQQIWNLYLLQMPQILQPGSIGSFRTKVGDDVRDSLRSGYQDDSQNIRIVIGYDVAWTCSTDFVGRLSCCMRRAYS